MMAQQHIMVPAAKTGDVGSLPETCVVGRANVCKSSETSAGPRLQRFSCAEEGETSLVSR